MAISRSEMEIDNFEKMGGTIDDARRHGSSLGKLISIKMKQLLKKLKVIR